MIRKPNFKLNWKYALGELVLIFLGISLAITFQNWNEAGEQTEEEIELLEELKEGFKVDLDDVQFNLRIYSSKIKSFSILINHIDQGYKYVDSLSIHFGRTFFPVKFISNAGPFETLKSKGIALISNDTLRADIIHMHDFSYEALKTWENGIGLNNAKYYEHSLPYFNIVMPPRPKREVITPVVPHDFEALKKDRFYMTVLRTEREQVMAIKAFAYSDLADRLTNLINEIDLEIERLK